ncbi:hypothetical protein HN419_06995 [Candidatus Woesearchaeota archaeon]|jgi:hypothetical protein|nr:hypothetical protein [Candidatus Woesearchaeota archaeon]MBT3538238.1 hypothetical protein [Candidatus Woesearchaeota archaeon]MBT4697692.1 hypothetical protein [Candidatus Woesearchaeota archaeon]MBT4717404.1 hypothetical protein [Candidatus Woesearchaeota archaeon]MBT7105907.1 hypothetical protein [Candidatus Woesearchaeota archaeon]
MENKIILILTLALILTLVGCKQIEEQKSENIIETPIPEINKTIPERIQEPLIKEETKAEEIISKATTIKEIPTEIENNCIGFLSGDPEETMRISSTGGAWVRPHIGAFVWGYIEERGYSETDKWVKESQKNNVAMLATLWPYYNKDQETCHNNCDVSKKDVFYPMDGHGLPSSRCAPCNYEDYKTFLKALIERYDGDGINDMPDLVIPIKYWEIMNEPEMQSSSLTFFKGTPEDYIEILKVSKEVIKEECPTCFIVQGGAAGSRETLTYWRNIFELGGDAYFDIANNHFVNHGDLETLNVREYKSLMDEYNIDKPLWITEVSFRPENPVEVVQGALNAGASRIFFSQFPISGKEWITDEKPPVIEHKGKKENGIDYQHKKNFGTKKLPEEDLIIYKKIIELCK